MIHRHLDYPGDTPVDELGAAAIDDLLDRGDLEDWAPLVRSIAAHPYGKLAETVLSLCASNPMYGTSRLWTDWIESLRARTPPSAAMGLASLRRRRGLTQEEVAERMKSTQSRVSKLERNADPKLSALRAYVAATEGELQMLAVFPGQPPVEIAPPP